MFLVIAIYMLGSWYVGAMPFGLKMIAYWFSAGLVSAIFIGVGSGVVTGTLSARYDLRDRVVTSSDKAIGYVWLVVSGFLVIFVCRFLLLWMY
jgi:hypothetical protein